MTAQPGRCSSSVEKVRHDDPAVQTGNASAYLPFVKLILFGLVLLYKVIQDLLQPFGGGPKSGDDILHGSLREDAINHAKALAVTRKRFQGLKNKLVLLGFLLDVTYFLSNLLQRVFVSAVLHLEVLLPLGWCRLRCHGCDI
jgi:hypothetical protein